MSTPELSVVIAVVDAAALGNGSLTAALDALAASCMRVSYEIIAVLPDMSAETSVPPSMRDGVHVLHAPSGALTPVMWGAGLHVARGRVVAFTTAQMRVGIDWAPSLLRALDTRDDKSIVGAGGPIELGTTDGAATDAAYFVRFSAFLPGLWNCVAPAADIPGDNAAYLRTALLQHKDLLTDGFWEVEFHRRDRKSVV